MNIEERIIEEVSRFIVDNKLIWHPKISPNGYPDFTNYRDHRFVLLVDRNILVRIKRLFETGQLKNKFDRKLVSALLIWCEINHVGISPMFAIKEGLSSNVNIEIENCIIQSIFEQYEPEQWIELFCGIRESVCRMNTTLKLSPEIYEDDQHYKTHYLSMLKLTQILKKQEISKEKKLIEFVKWNYENTIMCRYTTMLAALMLSGQSKLCRIINSDFNGVLKICRNQAWDLTNLSLWSTLYSTEKEFELTPLFCTHDKELKRVIAAAQMGSIEIFEKGFGKTKSNEILNRINYIVKPRQPRSIDDIDFDTRILKQEEELEQSIQNCHQKT